MLSRKEAVRANPLWWDNLMNKSILYCLIFLRWNDDFSMHVHVSSSKSVICLRAKRTFTCVIVCITFKIYNKCRLL